MWDTCHVNTCATAGKSYSSGLETFDAETDEATEATLRRRAVRGTYSRRNQCRKRRKRRYIYIYIIYIYIYIYNILAGYPASLETLSPGLSPPPSLVPLSPLSYSSLPSTLPPSGYPASLRITAFPRYFLNLEA